MSENALPTPDADDLPADPPAEDPPADAPADPPEDQPSGDDAPPDDPPPEPKKAEDRIREVIAEREALKEYGEYFRSQTMELTKQLQALQQGGKAAEKEIEDPAPKLEDFKNDTAKWTEAMADWADKRAEKRIQSGVKSELGKAKETEATEKAAARWNQRVTDFAKEHPDVHTVLSNPKLPITQTMTTVLLDSEKGVELAYHLGTNPAEATRISRLSSTQQARALGRLEAELEKPPEPPKNKTSNAPPPPNPVTGSRSPGINLETCSMDEYLAQRLGRKK